MIKAILSDGGNILFDDNPDRTFAVDYILQKTGRDKTEIEDDLQRMKDSLRYESVMRRNNSIEDKLPEGTFKAIDYTGRIGKPDEPDNGPQYPPSNWPTSPPPIGAFLKPKQDKKTESDITKDAYLLLLHAYGLENCKEFEELYLKNSQRKRELFPGVRDTLESLEGKLDFIIVTDAIKPGKKLYESLPRMGIQKGVKEVISSVDVGCAKPAPEFFDAVLQKNGYKKEETAFVGHDYDEVVGAYNYGIPHVIVFNYDEEELQKMREQIPAESLHIIPNTDKKDNFYKIKEILEEIAKSQG